jgi:hypothetical protein
MTAVAVNRLPTDRTERWIQAWRNIHFRVRQSVSFRADRLAVFETRSVRPAWLLHFGAHQWTTASTDASAPELRRKMTPKTSSVASISSGVPLRAECGSPDCMTA